MNLGGEKTVGGDAKSLEGPSNWTNAFTPGRLILLIGLFLFAAYPEVVLGTHSLFYRDFGLFTYPTAHFARESLWQGQLPLWNPLNSEGLPFLAQWNTTVCYPLSIIYLVLPLPWSLDYFCLGHLVLAGLGMYWLAWRWTENRFGASVAGLAYALNGLSFNCLMWTSNLAALAWMPSVLLAVERAWREGGRRLVPAALAGATQMLAGAPEIVLMTWLILGSLWLGQAWCKQVPWKISSRHLLLVGGLTGGLAAVQLLPFLELLRHSNRDPGQANAAWAMPAWGWANFVLPLFRTTRLMLVTYIQADQQWTSSYYMGIGVLGLALLAVWRVQLPRVRWMAIIALVGAFLALGEKGLLYGILVRVCPGFGLVRYPIKFVVLTVFALPVLSAYAVDWLNQVPAVSEAFARKSLVWVTTALVISLAAILAWSRWQPYPDESWAATLGNGAVRALLLILILGAGILLTRKLDVPRRRLVGFGLLILLGLDALTHMPRQNPTVANVAYGSLSLEMSSVPRLGRSRAMVSPRMQALLGNASTPNPLDYYAGMRRSLYSDCNLLEGVPKVNGFFSLALREETAVRALLYSPTNTPAGLMDFLGVSQISSPDVMFQWNARSTALPWVTGGQQPNFADPASTLQGLESPRFDPRRVVYLPLEVRTLVTATNTTAVEIVSSQFSPQKMVTEVKAGEPALLVVSQAMYPAWRAYVDDQPAALWRANYAFQALQVPAGLHRVRLVYRDWYFYTGGAISVLALLVCGWLQLLRRT